ncbi:MAG: AAA family ATPase [Nitrospinota bacterium]|nr:MAG: AAA family ATPase [Nitrospinota bacterium]
MSTFTQPLPEAPITDDLSLLLDVLPPDIRHALKEEKDLESLIEVVLDLGREPEARFPDRVFLIENRFITMEDLEYVTHRLGEFGKDNRAGIERTLHRISAIRNRRGKIVGLTCRVGRAVFGTIDIIRDVIETGKSILLLGRPGVGKTTKCREIARVLSGEFGKRVIVVDTSNEIAGDGDIPHPGIGRARRMQVPSPELQHTVMIEAVENHMPEVIVIDEIGTEEEARAARTIAERGVQLIATAHGNTLDRLLMNPTLSDLVGGVQAVILGDEEAKRRGTQKTVLERKAPPTFQILIEIQEMDRLAVYHDVGKAVDQILRGLPVQPEIRVQGADGQVEIITGQIAEEERPEPQEAPPSLARPLTTTPVRIFSYGVNRKRLERALKELDLPGIVTKDPAEAQVVVILKSHFRRYGHKLIGSLSPNIAVFIAKSNTYAQIVKVAQEIFRLSTSRNEEMAALREAEEAIQKVLNGERQVELLPQTSRIRKLQHQLAARYGLRSRSVGEDPFRRVQIFA